jgi:hypothetical protein
LWVANIDGQQRHRIYSEAGRHIYGACMSPDGRYVLFTRSIEDLGQVGAIEMAVIRWPTSMAGQGAVSAGPTATGSARVDLGPGWEPHWTSREVSTD